jgi:hypothetical protein
VPPLVVVVVVVVVVSCVHRSTRLASNVTADGGATLALRSRDGNKNENRELCICTLCVHYEYLCKVYIMKTCEEYVLVLHMGTVRPFRYSLFASDCLMNAVVNKGAQKHSE